MLSPESDIEPLRYVDWIKNNTSNAIKIWRQIRYARSGKKKIAANNIPPIMIANKKHKGRKSFQENKNSSILFEKTMSGVATHKMNGKINDAMSETASLFFFGVVSSFSFFVTVSAVVLLFIHFILKHSV